MMLVFVTLVSMVLIGVVCWVTYLFSREKWTRQERKLLQAAKKVDSRRLSARGHLTELGKLTVELSPTEKTTTLTSDTVLIAPSPWLTRRS